MQRTLLALLLSFLLISPAAFSWLATAWQQHAIREAVEAKLQEGMPASELTVLAFAKMQARQLLEWEHEREFEYEGQMYDIVRAETRGDSVFYTCYHDRAETALNQKLDRWMAEWLLHSPAQQEQGERLLCFFRSLACPDFPTYDSSALTNIQPNFFHLTCPGRTPGPPAPPPPRHHFNI